LVICQTHTVDIVSFIGTVNKEQIRSVNKKQIRSVTKWLIRLKT